MARETLQEIYGEGDNIDSKELDEVFKKLKEKYGDDWPNHLDDLEE